MTAPFGGHPRDQERAEKMFRQAIREGATGKDVAQEAQLWLEKYGVAGEELRRQLPRIAKFRPNPFRKRKLKSGWVVTWEGPSAPSVLSERVVSVLNYRTSSDRVRHFVEQLYIARYYVANEKLAYAQHPGENPYAAKYHVEHGGTWTSKITCGHNPYLYARRVANLVVDQTEENGAVLRWEEISIPETMP